MPINTKPTVLVLLFLATWTLQSHVLRAAEPMKVMTFNIRYDGGNRRLPPRETAWSADSGPNRRDMVLEVIDKAAPDLLGLQEVRPNQLEDLKQHLSDYEVYSVGRDDGKNAGEHCTIFYRRDRFERVDDGTFWLCETPEKPGAKHPQAACPRIASWVHLKDHQNDNMQFVFLDMHWDHVGGEARQFAAELIADRLAAMDSVDRVILCGDTNARPDSPEIKGLLADKRLSLLNSYRQVHPEVSENELTFNGFRGETKGRPIDYVFCSPSWKVLSAEYIRTDFDGLYPSDHYPVVVKLAPAE
ncbi:endonuclease/exonuclease/phosphatase family protein [Aeoliella sp. ICT_H6.2]|uniref:Endonuclease/exonuclease/phosphatase family protein n=1 Tax=Aeoliella straminimaris TaxID=2954799 RepID=A0A9X2JFK0_9BACT|nr:endonuclease/exonuclease/phosphatase family protein [Aeoliella straminimaris]MCO6043796.1 endonuclease/exonuclease/phosphatase family protein [Aeoliella straminimaris]